MIEDDADEDRMMLVKGEIGDQINGGPHSGYAQD